MKKKQLKCIKVRYSFMKSRLIASMNEQKYYVSTCVVNNISMTNLTDKIRRNPKWYIPLASNHG